MQGRLLPWSLGNAAWNMAVDETLLQFYRRGRSPITLRFYGWEPPALSWGYFQPSPGKKVLDRCKEKKVGWVRRPTGGRAVLHHEEITYSLVAGGRDGFKGPVLTDYRRIANGLKKGFGLLGLPVEMNERAMGPKAHSSQACFASSSWYELTCQGRKLVGSAQLRTGCAFLQHGSIPYRFDLCLLLDLIGEEGKPALAAKLEQRVMGLEEAVGYCPLPSQVMAALVAGMGEALGVTWVEGALTEEEQATAQRLAEGKYSCRG